MESGRRGGHGHLAASRVALAELGLDHAPAQIQLLRTVVKTVKDNHI